MQPRPLLAAMLSLDRMFHDDFDDGSLEQIALGMLPLELVALAKTIAHWLTTGLPLVIAAPVLGRVYAARLGGGATPSLTQRSSAISSACCAARACPLAGRTLTIASPVACATTTVGSNRSPVDLARNCCASRTGVVSI